MRVTLRLESVCLSTQLLPEDAIAIVQEVGRAAVRQIDDGRTPVAVPYADDLHIDSFGDVGWNQAALVEPAEVVAALGRLLESLLRIAEDADQYHFSPAVLLIIGRAIGASDTDPFSSPLELLRTLDRLGPVDNNAAIRALYHRWEQMPHAPVAVEVCPVPQVQGSPSQNHGPMERSCEPVTTAAVPLGAPAAAAHLSRKDVRELSITTLAAVASTVLFVPVLMGMTPSTPARAAATIAARTFATELALPPAPLPARRPMVPARAANRGARVAAEPRVVRTSTARPSRARASILTRVLAGDGRHRVQPFPRPTGLD
jgi:hypothetical protein